jgi:hypothetical protein
VGFCEIHQEEPFSDHLPLFAELELH